MAISYRLLGRELKALREKSRESLAQVSDAVEIDVKQLANYELGQDRPNEEILLLLISHFQANETLAIKLWGLAGYNALRIGSAALPSEIVKEVEADADQPKVLFTDTVDIIVNNHGVVMNFKQHNGNHQSVTIARVGMSREHAKSVLRILETTLAQTETPNFKLPGSGNSAADKA